MGYPRMNINKQAELVPCILNAIEGKPLSHQDRYLLSILSELLKNLITCLIFVYYNSFYDKYSQNEIFF